MVEVEIEISEKALKAAAKLGRRMAKEDKTIRPDADMDWRDAEANDRDLADYSDFVAEHRRGWEDTDQFKDVWLEAIIDITEADFEDQGGERSVDNMLWYEEFQEPAKDAFWEAWETSKRMLRFWQRHYQGGRPSDDE